MSELVYPFVKGHGTHNDFVLLPDHEGQIHGSLSAARVSALCDRRGGIGGDGVLRVVRCAVAAPEQADRAEWFMDYRNADGGLAQMCGNGIRVFVHYLQVEGLAGPGSVRVGTRDGVKVVTCEDDGRLTADLGTPRVLATTQVRIGDHSWPARHADLGNPHAVAFVDDLSQAGPLLDQPVYDEVLFPEGVNIEFVTRCGPRHVAMRVFERGSGETWSCGTGAAAVMAVTAVADGSVPPKGGPGQDVHYRVDVPGGSLGLTWTSDDRALLTGPAVLVAQGTTSL